MKVRVKNIMEDIVSNRMESIIKKIQCCECEQCMSDVASYVLNRVKPKYVSTVSGELYSKSIILKPETENELVLIIAEAAKVVKDTPRH